MDISLHHKKIILAYCVHLFTVTGLLFALVATWCISQGLHGNPIWVKWFFIFMTLCVLVDAVDGTLARKFEVKKYTPQIDGALLDNMIDYITFAFLPGYFVLVNNNVIENPLLSIIATAGIIISASYQFCRADAKISGDEHYFVGFPSYWNMVVIYLYWLQLSEIVNLLVILVLSILSFVPFKWVYPSRTKYLMKVTLSLLIVYSIAVSYEILLNFEQPHQWFFYLSYIVFTYYTLLSLYLNIRDKYLIK